MEPIADFGSEDVFPRLTYAHVLELARGGDRGGRGGRRLEATRRSRAARRPVAFAKKSDRS
jgi:hypothetical protein